MAVFHVLLLVFYVRSTFIHWINIGDWRLDITGDSFDFGQSQFGCFPQVHCHRDHLIHWTWLHDACGWRQMVAGYLASVSRWGPSLCCSGFSPVKPPTRLSPHAYYSSKIVLPHESGCWQYEKQARSYWVCVKVCYESAVVSISWTVVGWSVFVQLLTCNPLQALKHTSVPATTILWSKKADVFSSFCQDLEWLYRMSVFLMGFYSRLSTCSHTFPHNTPFCLCSPSK